ncbi:MAG: hypothetical protein AAB626_03200 [Patescibacteria group bacterium]
MSKLNKGLLLSVILLAIVLGAILWMPSIFGASYYAVYLANGDLYFGKMAWYSPRILTDVRVIQQQKDEKEQPVLSLVSFKDSVVWGPAGDLKLNSKNILWTSKLTDESQVVKLIKEGK